MSHTPHTVVSVRVYVTIFVLLMVFTGLTVLAGYQDFGFANTVIALSIAVTKASLVVLFFMGVRHNTPLTKVVVIAGFFWLFILFGLGMSDYLTRPWIGVPGR
ncbi:MAG TPA: cytochrome C oxidase subunit IV family protein [Vicinamibacterales bacterium]|nr:cytochrome C oxidase subunit IV family protein [Vicinamibacterales bacterium]